MFCKFKFIKMARTSAAGAALLTAAQAHPAWAQPPSYTAPAPAYVLNIPGQDLASALRAFARASRQQIVFDKRNLAGKRSNPVRGTYTAKEGLGRILAGSGLAAQAGQSGIFIIRPANRSDEQGVYTVSEQAPGGLLLTPQGAERGAAIVVTGSRLGAQTKTSNPVVTASGKTLERSGKTNITDFLQDYPALSTSFDDEDSSNPAAVATAGLNLLDLRGFGTQRTLVLVNGRRHVASEPGSSAVDISTIPVALIDRVDILTGGASAVYGADGVSGVVNFILKEDFRGLSARAQIGRADEKGGRSGLVSVLAGTNFGAGRGNITLAAEYAHSGRVRPQDRHFTNADHYKILLSNPADYPGDDPNIADYIFAENGRYIDSAPGGAVKTDLDNSDSLSGVDFTGDGQRWVDGLYGGDFMIGGSGTLVGQFVDDLLPKVDRAVLNSTFHFDIGSGQRIFAEAKWSHVNAQYAAQPTFDYNLIVRVTNPFMPQAIRDAALAPGGLGALAGFVLVNRDNFDLGRQQWDIDRNTVRTVVGLKGKLHDSINYELSYVWGRSQVKSERSNDRVTERWLAAIDAVRDPNGNIVCGTTLDPKRIPLGANRTTWGSTFTPGPESGCIPVNIFGENVTPEAAAWINATTVRRSRLDQHVLNGFVRGDSSPVLKLPGGPVSFVLGGEYRQEKSEELADPLQKAGTNGLTFSGSSEDIVGKYHVIEAFGEVSAPILKDVPFARELTVDAAYRQSDYSTTGTGKTWKVGAIWRPASFLLLRATKARAVRAPNIEELYRPRGQIIAPLIDPCAADNYRAGTGLRAAACNAALGFDPSTFAAPPANVFGTSGGNPDLRPEKANTVTAGIVLTPGFLRGFTSSIDYYDIKLSDAIEQTSAQLIIEQCYDLPQPNQFCSLFARDPSTRRLTSFTQGVTNIAAYRGSGVDFTVQYALDPRSLGLGDHLGRLNFQLVGSKLIRRDVHGTANAPARKLLGSAGVPKWQATFDATWTLDRLLMNYGFSWAERTRRFSKERRAADPDYVEPRYFRYSAKAVHDIQARYQLPAGIALYGGINNFTNQQPDVGSLNQPVGPLGRFFYLGLTADLGR